MLRFIIDCAVYLVGVYSGCELYRWTHRKKYGMGYAHFRQKTQKFMLENGQLIKKDSGNDDRP